MTFKAYDSLEEMFQDIDTANRKANEAATEEQRDISWGNHYMMFFEDFPIFGYIFTPEENMKSCLESGGDKNECTYEADTTADSFKRGYRFSRAYSVVVPDGELGSNHIANMVPITKEQFEEAKRLNWFHDDLATQTDWYWSKGVNLTEIVLAQQDKLHRL